IHLPPGLDSISVAFATLFALPAVRGVMPSTPPFDFFGIIPNLLLVGFSTALLLLWRIKREKTAFIRPSEG
ncbi:hypothetical protein BKA62DRAFT_721065, partial [Auriculariales sp. MPI-PUGE-AT-0066]